MNDNGYRFKCEKCGIETNHQIRTDDLVWHPLCIECDNQLEKLFDRLPFPAEDVIPGNKESTICDVVLQAFLWDPIAARKAKE